MKKLNFATALSALLALLGGAAGAASTFTYTAMGNATWTSPVTGTVQIECWGGGGGGGGVGATNAEAGGGAGGSYVRYSVPVTLGTTYNLTVGAGGAGGTGGAAGSGTAGGTGGSSFFGSATAGDPTTASVLAVGGPGGALNNTAGTSTSHYTGSAGGTATTTGNVPSSGAAADTAGTSGAASGTGSTKLSGAGGAGAGPSGSTGGGEGAAGITSAGNGIAGYAPGGGGSGGLQVTSPANGTGGGGGSGQVAITVSTPFAFTPGNLAVLQPGDANSNNTTITILEVMTNVSGQPGTYTVGIDGTNASGLLMSGSAGTSGYLANSADGTLLAFAGAGTNTIKVNSITNRGVGTLNAAANYVLQTTYTNPAAGTTASQPRDASTIDNVHWVIADQSGMYTNGANSAQPPGNFLGAKSFGGSNYTMSASATVPVVMTYSAGATNYLTGIPADANATDFYLITSGQNGPSFDVLYFIDDTGPTAGTIYKYTNSLSTGTWGSAGTYSTGLGGWGLCAATNSGGVNLYFTTGTGSLTNNSVIQLTDTANPLNSLISITPGSGITLYTAPPGEILKGIAFVPAAAAPTVASSAATLIGTTSATLNGSVVYDGGSALTSYGFYWGTGEPITTSSNLIQVGTSDYSGSYTANLTGLGVNAHYYYRAYADNTVGNTLGGSDVSFWTLASTPTAPTVVGGSSTTSLTVTIGAGDGNPATTLYAIKETTSGEFVQSGGTLGGSAVFQTASTWSTKTVTGLNPSTTYTFEVEAQNGAGTNTVFGPTANGTTATPASPTISVTPDLLNFPPTLVGTTSAALTYSVSGTNLTGNIVITAPANFQVSTSSGSGFGGTVTLPLSGNMVASTTIYVQFQPTSQTGYSGNITDVSSGADNPSVALSGIGATAPSVTTQAANPTNVASASLNGTVTATNGAFILDRGFYWSASPNVSTLTGAKLSEGGTTLGAFSKVLSGLNTNAAYYYRAYASNSVGFTLAGADVVVDTLAATPTAPTVGSPTINTLSVAIGAGDGNPAGTAYAIQETNSGNYVQINGTLAATPVVFQTASLWGTKTVTDLAPGTAYAFAVMATNSIGIPTAFGPVTIAYTVNQPFTQGNVAVLQADVASANNTAFAILEVNPNTATLVQTVPINGTSGTNALRVSGSAGSAPKLANSGDGTYLVMAGFNSTNGSVTANTITNRAVATLDADTRFTLQTTFVGISGNQVRSATSVDNQTWFVADAGGIYTNGITSPLFSDSVVSIKSFGGTNYVLQSSKSTVPISSVSADGNTLTGLQSLEPTLTSRDSTAVDFCMVVSGNNGSTNYDILYVLNETATNAGTIAKYYLDYGNTGNWVLAGTYDDSTITTPTPYAGLGGYALAAATNSTGDVDLYLTTGDGTVANNSIWQLIDEAGASSEGWQSSPNITPPASPLYTAAGGATLKGVAFVPNPVLVSSVAFSPNTASVVVGGTTNLSGAVQFLPANATTQTVTWHSDNTGVATVNAAGLVTANAAGSAHVYVTTTDGSNLSATNLVTVVTAATVITPLTVTPGSVKITGSGASASVSFSFTNAVGLSFSILATNNIAAPVATWPVIGTVTDTNSNGHYQFAEPLGGGGTYFRLRQP